MSDYTTTAKIDLHVNGNQVADKLNDLKQRAFNFENAIAKAASAGDKVSLKKLRQEVASTKKEIRNTENSASSVADVLSRLNKASPKELTSTLFTLNAQLKKTERGSQAWNEHVAKIKQVKAEIAKVNASLQANESLLSRCNKKIQQWGTSAMGAIAALTGIVFTARQAIKAYGDMEEEKAQVRKFTGFTEDQVNEVNEHFKKLDTRTARAELNKLAGEAGRLGKTSMKEVKGFVDAANIINVALNDLGEGATLSISKLTKIFGDEKILGTEKSMLAVGSVVNELSQNCTAAAPYLVDFSARLAGVGAQSKLTIPQIMSFAAVLDSQGQKVEMSATAFSQLIMKMFQDPAKLAKTLGLDVKEFANTLKTSTNDALLMLLSRLKELGGMDVLTPIFKDMGVDGARASQVLSTLAKEVNTVKSQQIEASKAFTEATSVTKEYNIQNNTVNAGLDKAKKKFNEISIELGEKLFPVMKHVISGSSALLRVIKFIIETIDKYIIEIAILTATILAYNIAVNASAIAFRVHYGWLVIAKVATTAWTVATQLAYITTALFSRNLRKARQEFFLLSAVIKVSPIGLLTGIITAAVVATIAYASSITKVSLAKKQLNDIEISAQSKAKESLAITKSLYDASQDQNRSMADRIKAIEHLKSMHADYFSELSTEAFLAGNAADAYERLATNILAKARAEGMQEQLKNNEVEIARLEGERNTKINNAVSSTNLDSRTATRWGGNKTAAIENEPDLVIVRGYLDQVNEDYSSQIKAFTEANETLSKKITDSILKGDINAVDTGGDPAVPPVKPEESKKTVDKYASEKAWYDNEVALARIAWSIGEIDYRDYKDKMFNLDLEFLSKKIENSKTEKAEITILTAEMAELSKKYQDELIANNEAVYKRDSTIKMQELKTMLADGLLSEKAYSEAVFREEIAYLERVKSIHKEGSEERANIERQINDKLLNDKLEKQKAYEKKLEDMKSKHFSATPEENEAGYNEEMGILDSIYEERIVLYRNDAKALLELEEQYQKAKLAMQLKYNQAGSDDTANSYTKAIMKTKEWLDGDGGKALTGTVDFLTQSISAITSQLSESVKIEQEIQLAAVSSKYDKEISMAEGNSYKIKQLEKKKAEEEAKIKKEANRKMFAMQVIQAIATTAQGALSAYASTVAIPIVGTVLAPIAAAVAVATGMIQVANIKKQQQASEAQGYYDGGFTRRGINDREEAGVVHQNEWVASSRLLRNPNARPIIEALDYAQRTNTIGSLRSPNVITVDIPQNSPTQGDNDSRYIEQSMYLISAAIKRLNDRLDAPFVTVNTVTGEHGIKSAQDEYDQYINNKSPKTKWK